MITNSIPSWKASGDWFDVCKCKNPCACEFAQEPTYGPIYINIVTESEASSAN